MKNNWINRHINDFFVKKSKLDGYISRAAYKLIDIETKYNILTRSKTILELGAAPGGWLQVLMRCNQLTNIVAIDLLKVDGSIPINRITIDDYKLNNTKYKNIFIQCDFNHFIPVCNDTFDTVLSDISSNITGIRDRDIEASNNIINTIVTSKNIFHQNSNLIIKFFRSHTDNELISWLKEYFNKVNIYKPEASRKNSSEAYLICQYYK